MTRPYHDREWLEREYLINGRTYDDIAEECGVSRQAVCEMAKKFGIKRMYAWEKLCPMWLRREYVEKRRRMVDLAKEKGVSLKTLRNALRMHRIVRAPYTPEERRQRYNERQNRRYAEDPERRRQIRETAARWQREHPEAVRKIQRKYRESHRDEINARHRERWKAAQTASVAQRTDL